MLMNADRSSLLIVDVQERLAPVMDDPRRVIRGGVMLIRAAARLGVPVLASEQYPPGLGPTMTDLRNELPPSAFVAKTAFNCAAEPALLARLQELGRPQVVIAGIEAHVCVLQSALGLKAVGFEVFVVEDACSSRRPEAEKAACRRLAAAGVSMVTLEMVLFEWLGSKDHPAFKDLQRLIR